MDYQAERGGKVVFQDVAKPASMEWGSPLQAMEAVLELEKTVSVGCTMLSRAGHTKIIVRFATTTTRQRNRAWRTKKNAKNGLVSMSKWSSRNEKRQNAIANNFVA